MAVYSIHKNKEGQEYYERVLGKDQLPFLTDMELIDIVCTRIYGYRNPIYIKPIFVEQIKVGSWLFRGCLILDDPYRTSPINGELYAFGGNGRIYRFGYHPKKAQYREMEISLGTYSRSEVKFAKDVTIEFKREIQEYCQEKKIKPTGGVGDRFYPNEYSQYSIEELKQELCNTTGANLEKIIPLLYEIAERSGPYPGAVNAANNALYILGAKKDKNGEWMVKNAEGEDCLCAECNSEELGGKVNALVTSVKMGYEEEKIVPEQVTAKDDRGIAKNIDFDEH